MAVLIDPAVWPWRGERWSHLVSDVSYAELHAFAAALGVPERAFQGDHYDLPARLRPRALDLGAVPVPARELLARLKGAGLRRAPVRPLPPPDGGCPGRDHQDGYQGMTAKGEA